METEVHRLRDLPPAGWLAAGLVGVVLLLAPALALVHFLPDWGAGGEDAFLGLRAYDVGTGRTPLIGQPWPGELGQDADAPLAQPGPVHAFVLAPFVRLVGAGPALPLVSAVLAGSVALLVPWVFLRQLGPRAAVLAALLTALVMFTRGAGTLVSPASSVVAGSLLFVSTVLVWALLCGDDALVPLTAVIVSSVALVDLAALPVAALLGLAAIVGTAAGWWRQGFWSDATIRRRAGVLSAIAAAITLLLWVPTFAQQLVGDHPNLSAVLGHLVDGDAPAVGGGSAVRQVTHVLGWPSLWGSSGREADLGADLVAQPSRTVWLTAGVVLVVAAVGGRRWQLQGQGIGAGNQDEGARRRSLLVVTLGVLLVAGLATGSRSPAGGGGTGPGPDALRPVGAGFQQWAWPLAFLATVVVIQVVAEVGTLVFSRNLPRHTPIWLISDESRAGRGAALRAAAFAGTVVVILVLALVSTRVERDANRRLAMGTTRSHRPYEALAEQITLHRHDLRGPVLLATEGPAAEGGRHPSLALELEEQGVPVVHPQDRRDYVADDRVVDPATVEAALVLELDRAAGLPGRQLARWGDLRVTMVTGVTLTRLLEDRPAPPETSRSSWLRAARHRVLRGVVPAGPAPPPWPEPAAPPWPSPARPRPPRTQA